MLSAALAVAVLSLTFAAQTAQAFPNGDVFVSVADGKVNEYTPSGTLVQTLDTTLGGFTTGSAFDTAGNFYVTAFSASNVSKFDPSGALLGTFGSGYSTPEDILFDGSGNAYVGNLGGFILKFDSAGSSLATSNNGRTDWMDLAADQCTMFFTDEGPTIHRYDVCTNAALTDFASPGGEGFALRLLPTGGLLLADGAQILRLDAAGNVIQTYDAAGEDEWFALNLDPDGTTFWSADIATSNVYRFNINTGAQVSTFNTGTPGDTVFGLSVRGEITVAQPTLTLEPATATNDVGTSHTVTATLKDGTGTAINGGTILFSVSGANTTTGSGTTNASGQATFTYTGTSAGGDTITACYDKNTSGTCNTGEVTATATKTWTQTATPCTIKVTNGGWIVTDDGDRGSFGGNAKESATGTDTGQEEYQDHGPAEPLNVHSLRITDITCNATLTKASIFGTATINGTGTHTFQIDVEDNGEPGKGKDHYRIRLDTGYDSGDHILRGGNVQIH